MKRIGLADRELTRDFIRITVRSPCTNNRFAVAVKNLKISIFKGSIIFINLNDRNFCRRVLHSYLSDLAVFLNGKGNCFCRYKTISRSFFDQCINAGVNIIDHMGILSGSPFFNYVTVFVL